MKRCVAGVVAVTIVCWVSVSAQNFSVAGLGAGESIEIRYASRGCFSHTAGHIEIRKREVHVADVSSLASVARLWNGERHHLVSYPLEVFFQSNPDKRLESDVKLGAAAVALEALGVRNV